MDNNDDDDNDDGASCCYIMIEAWTVNPGDILVTVDCWSPDHDGDDD